MGFRGPNDGNLFTPRLSCLIKPKQQWVHSHWLKLPHSTLPLELVSLILARVKWLAPGSCTNWRLDVLEPFFQLCMSVVLYYLSCAFSVISCLLCQLYAFSFLFFWGGGTSHHPSMVGICIPTWLPAWRCGFYWWHTCLQFMFKSSAFVSAVYWSSKGSAPGCDQWSKEWL